MDNHKEQILYGKAGVAAGLNAGSPIAIVVFLRDQAIVAARLADDFVVLPVKFVHFRTLAIENRSTEVWRVLGAVKTEFGRFGALLAKTKDKLDQVGRTLDDASRKSTTIARKLRDVEALPDDEADRLLTAEDGRLVEVDDAADADVPALVRPPH